MKRPFPTIIYFYFYLYTFSFGVVLPVKVLLSIYYCTLLVSANISIDNNNLV